MRTILLTFTAFSIACQAKLYNLVTESPNQTYMVKASEREGVTNEPYNYFVSLQVFRRKQLIVDVASFSGRDGMDRRFGDEYPEHTWISENILHLGNNLLQNQPMYDIVIVENDTNKTISYLMIGGKSEMFLAFDLPSKSRLEFKPQPQTDQGADSSWIGYAGQCADGKHINGGGINFRIGGKYSNPAHYCVTITSSQVAVTSREFEGYKFLSGVETTTPPNTNCGR